MGWCSGTRIFDGMLSAFLNEDKLDKKEFIKQTIIELEDMDWDCQMDSAYWYNPLVQEIFKELHPDWFEEDLEE